jgi:chloride channel protein, CIC family
MAKFPFKPSRLLMWVRKIVGNDQLILSLLAIVVGAAAGGAGIVLREAIGLVQTVFFGAGDSRLFIHAAGLAWWHVLLAPTVGGLAIGLFVRHFMPDGRPQGVADVIEANALRHARMSLPVAFRAGIVNAASIGVGASTGREGPAVHLGAALGGWLAERLHLTRTLSRTLLGCGVAAAVAAAFNAPIAGALFASEVVIGHYALNAFAPFVIASVTGTAVSRAYFGDFPAFIIAGKTITSWWEFSAFVGLGILAGIVAVLFMRAVALAESTARRAPVPPWMRPAIGGLIVGTVAIFVPHVLGVGYGATEAALHVSLPLSLLVAVCAAKLATTAVSIGFGFGGGVFSPALVIGAMLGGAYGIVVTEIVPDFSSGAGVYTIIGMGAMAAAVLGAPISTTLIVFEMTGDYEVTIAVMVAVVVASVITQQFHGRSFFSWQLERRGLDLKGGFEATLLRGITVGDVMETDWPHIEPQANLPQVRQELQNSVIGELFVVHPDGVLFGTITLADLSDAAFDHDFDDLVNAVDVARQHPPAVVIDDTLDTALRVIRENGEAHIAVVVDAPSQTFAGCLHERDVMAAYNRALVQHRREERGE